LQPPELVTIMMQPFENMKENQELRRQIRLRYEWAGNNKGNREYSYYAMWRVNPKAGRWDIIDQKVE